MAANELDNISKGLLVGKNYQMEIAKYFFDLAQSIHLVLEQYNMFNGSLVSRTISVSHDSMTHQKISYV